MARRKPKARGSIDWKALTEAAREVRERAYAPYSKYRVGAAVLGASGKTYVGCNVENASYGLTVCAERNAVGAAVAAGEKKILACAISVTGRPAAPCGMCRQVLREFGSATTPIALVSEGRRTVHVLGDLLPHAFDISYL